MRCQRCERPVCPECQRPAAVGVQCVDCVARDARSTPVQRTIFGTPITAGSGPRTYLVTCVIIVICVLAWVGELLRPSLVDNFAFGPVVGWDEPWRVITGAFLHEPSSPLHIGLNMYALWIVGRVLEPALGRLRFTLLYVACAIGGAVMIVLLAPAPSMGSIPDGAWFSGTIGASGAIFGLFGTLVVLNRAASLSNRGMYVVLAINFVYGFLVPNVSWQGHLGGLVTGALAGGAIVALRKQPRLQIPAIVVVAVVVALLAVIKYLGVPGALR